MTQQDVMIGCPLCNVAPPKPAPTNTAASPRQQ
jgi:hypothetical protein